MKLPHKVLTKFTVIWKKKNNALWVIYHQIWISLLCQWCTSDTRKAISAQWQRKPSWGLDTSAGWETDLSSFFSDWRINLGDKADYEAYGRQHPLASCIHWCVTRVMGGAWGQRMLHMEVQQWWRTQLRGSRGCSASHVVPHQEESSQHILWINTEFTCWSPPLPLHLCFNVS